MSILAQVVASAPEPRLMLDMALGLLVEAVQADRGLLVLFDEQGDPAQRAAHYIRDEELHGPQFACSRSLLAEAGLRREPVLVADALCDPRFADAESVTSLEIRSALAVPVLRGEETRSPVCAVLYLDDRTHTHRFGAEALALAQRLVHELLPVFHLVLDREQLQRDIDTLKARVHETTVNLATRQLLGHSSAMEAVRREIGRAGATHFPVVIQGESGSGKELVARAIHAASPRSQGPFVVESCAAFSEALLESELFGHEAGAFTGATDRRIGLFEAASGGTLFLDEVSSMSPALQAKLLRVLQEGAVRPVGAEKAHSVDVRVIAASNESLRALVQAGRMREDLFYRLAVLTIELPPLRARSEDVPILVEKFAQRFAAECGRRNRPTFSEAALRALTAYSWPGNVRQLENEVRRLVTFRLGRILKRHLSPEIADSSLSRYECLALEEALTTLERDLIVRALRRTKGNVSEAARLLGVERTKLQRRMKRYQL